jgi:hypothetical protein
MENPRKVNWKAMKWVLWYLKGTNNYCVIYNHGSDLVCKYLNSYFAADLDKRRLTLGYVLSLASGVITWISKL